MFYVDFVRHSSMPTFDERQVFVDPEVYHEQGKRQLNRLGDILSEVLNHDASIFIGPDRSGKTLIGKKLQAQATEEGEPTIIMRGSEIRNADVGKATEAAIVRQLSSQQYPREKISIIIDDFDECTLPDSIKERIIRFLADEFRRTIIFSFTSAPTVLFTPDDLPNPESFLLEPLGDDKVYQLVQKWRCIGNGHDASVSDALILQSHEKILLLFSQTDVQKFPYNAVTFLELIDSSVGGDIAPSSFASCYDALIQRRLIHKGLNPGQHDEIKNFLSLVAYQAYCETETGFLSKEGFADCVDIFVSQYFSSAANLKRMSIDSFLIKEATGYRFAEDYLWYFLCARYVGKNLSRDDPKKYNAFIKHCSSNIFQKRYANIIIYLAYFTDDNAVLRELMDLLDRLFSKADDWVLSDRSRSLILGLATSDNLSISSSSDVEESRLQLMKENVRDVVNNAEDVVAKYTLPFLDPHIEDSELVDIIEPYEIDSDSYMKSVNALLRTHSVIGQILNSRAGTYGATLVLDCITKMVQASGRYASLNHAIATILIFDPDIADQSSEGVLRADHLTPEERRNKIVRIFSFWSVYLSQTGLARYLSQNHSMRALEKLAEEFESRKDDQGHFPFNFTSVLLIARLYESGQVDKPRIEAAIEKYGKDSALFSVVRATLFIYSYYMPMTISDKQWIESRLGLPVRAVEMQKLRAARSGHLDKKSLLDIDPKQDGDADTA